ncbi:MAG TPA: glycosyltransferase family 4 protein [Solirubrobacteraceae bacterium]
MRVGAPVALLDVLRDGPVPLQRDVTPRAANGSLSVAIVVPPFRRGSGGHGTLAQLVRGLEARGHTCSFWILDEEGRHEGESAARTAELFRDFFGPVQSAIHKGFAAWDGADVVVATGWQTMPAVLRRPGTTARAYLVQDHEPEFYGSSAERGWAEWTYRQGVHCIAASRWLAGVLHERYGASASSFDLAVDHARYRPASEARRDDLVLFYARAVTPRRAVPLGLLALEELHRRRPAIELALFGEARPIATSFPHAHLGVLEPDGLARAYGSAAAGLVLSLTNPSLIPLEMMACGLPCVEAASAGMLASFGENAPISLAPLDPIAIANGLDRLLADRDLRAQRSREGIAWAGRRTWEAAAAQVEDGLREALRGAAG